MVLSDKSYFCPHWKIHKLKPDFRGLIECGLWCWLHGWCSLGLSDCEWAQKYNKSKLSVIKAFEFFWWSQKHHQFRILLKIVFYKLNRTKKKTFKFNSLEVADEGRGKLIYFTSIFCILLLFHRMYKALSSSSHLSLSSSIVRFFSTFFIRTFVHYCVQSYCSMFSEISTSRLFV